MNFFVKILALLALALIVNFADAQRILLVEKPGKFKNFKYFVGNDITLKTYPDGLKQKGTIHVITDTSIVINFDNEIMLEEIQMILRRRWGFSLVSKITRIAGAGYFLLDVVNRAINNDSPVVDKNTVMISAGLVAFSYALVPLHNRRMEQGEKWRIRVLNMSMDMDVPNPFQQ
jgi:hypothetical protein